MGRDFLHKGFGRFDGGGRNNFPDHFDRSFGADFDRDFKGFSNAGHRLKDNSSLDLPGIEFDFGGDVKSKNHRLRESFEDSHFPRDISNLFQKLSKYYSRHFLNRRFHRFFPEANQRSEKSHDDKNFESTGGYGYGDANGSRGSGGEYDGSNYGGGNDGGYQSGGDSGYNHGQSSQQYPSRRYPSDGDMRQDKVAGSPIVGSDTVVRSAPGDLRISGPPTISPATIDSVLGSHGSPVAGKGQEIYDICVSKGIDPAIALAFFGKESTFGTDGLSVQTNSWGNIREGQNGWRTYANYLDGLSDWCDLMNDEYVKPVSEGGRGLPTLQDAIPVYAPAGDGNDPGKYVSDVSSWIADWRQQDAAKAISADEYGKLTASSGLVKSGDYVFPVVGYDKDSVLTHWEEDGATGASDIMMPPGTPIVAFGSGKVIDASYNSIGGNSVLIQQDDGLTAYYAHMLNEPLVKAGDVVKAGQPLGEVGNTGNAANTPSHLHFGLGYGIKTGAGPQGGAGDGDGVFDDNVDTYDGPQYDAVGLLNQVLANGKASDIPSGKVSEHVRGTPAPDNIDNPSAKALYDGGCGGQCTYYAASRHATPWVDPATPGLTGNAQEWYGKAQAAGVETTNATEPVVGSIACWDYQHVAIVEKVFDDLSFLVSEMNVVDADPYNWGSGIVSQSTHYAGEPGLQGFIV